MVNGSCREWTTGVFDQEYEKTDLEISFTEMTQGTLVMSGRAERGLRLSPQSMIDIVGIHQQALPIRNFCISQEYGLEKLEVYPFINVSRGIPLERAHEVFQTPPQERYRLTNIQYVRNQNSIKARLCEMFGPGGSKYPCVVIVDMCGFNAQVARQVARGTYVDPVTGVRGGLYRPTQAERDAFRASNQAPHAMVVVGVNTDFEDEALHRCEVKNSQGTGWGEGGFSKIPFDFICKLFIPEP